eukprot:gene10323-12075_t
MNSALKSVKVILSGLTDGSSPAIISPLQHIQDVSVAGCTRGHQHMGKLMTLFPAVLVLELNSAILTDENLIQIVSSCPKVNVLLLNCGALLTEESLQVAVQRWALKAFALRGGGIYSDQLLQCIAKHGATTVNALRFVSPSTFTNDGIVNLIRACPKLKNIALGWHPISPYEFVDIVAPMLSKFVILVLAQGLCSDAVLSAVGKCCPRLEVLDLMDDKLGTCFSSGTGLVFLLEHCHRLDTLVVNSRVQNLHLVSPFVRKMLQSIRPDLQVSSDEKHVHL